MALDVAELEHLYKAESDPDVKERLLLVLKVECDGMTPSGTAKELHRSRDWACGWMRRYRKEGVEGLKTQPRCGRPPDIPPEVALRIQNKLKESKQG